MSSSKPSHPESLLWDLDGVACQVRLMGGAGLDMLTGPGLTASCPPPEVSLESSHRGFHLLFVAFGCGFGLHVCYMTHYIFFSGRQEVQALGSAGWL